ncbi:MAG: hypothetical protein VX871_10475 [Pseudomonadota bacterium]|nr:hypothetical protein [Pseudomonadota bacterium]
MSLMTHLRRKTADKPATTLGRHEGFISSYVSSLETAPAQIDDLLVTVIARSAESVPVRALLGKAEELAAAGVSIRAIFADIEMSNELLDFCAAASRLAGGADPSSLVRWAHRDSLADAHEQVTLGTRMCWSGDAIRRRADVRDGLNLFEQTAPATVRLGTMAFVAIWDISERVSPSRLKADRRNKPCGAYGDVDGSRLAAFSFLEKDTGAGLLRH